MDHRLIMGANKARAIVTGDGRDSEGCFWVFVSWWYGDKLKLVWWRVVVFMWLFSCLKLHIIVV